MVSGVFAVHAGAAAALSAWLAPRVGRAGVLVLPAAWLVMEHLRGFDFLGGFKWAALGYAAHLRPAAARARVVAGVYGLSFVMALAGTLLGVGRWPIGARGRVALAHLLGFLALPRRRPISRRRAIHRSASTLVQGNIPQGEKWDPARAQRNLAGPPRALARGDRRASPI